MSKKIIRKLASEQDWEILLDLERKAAEYSPYYLAFTNIADLREFVGKSVVYLMFDGAKPIGHVEYESKGDDSVEITGFVILPEYRGKGLGKILFERAMEDLKETKTVFLMTHPENSVALQVYLSTGFIIKEWKENYYGNGQPRLRLELLREET